MGGSRTQDGWGRTGMDLDDSPSALLQQCQLHHPPWHFTRTFYNLSCGVVIPPQGTFGEGSLPLVPVTTSTGSMPSCRRTPTYPFLPWPCHCILMCDRPFPATQSSVQTQAGTLVDADFPPTPASPGSPSVAAQCVPGSCPGTGPRASGRCAAH